MMKFLFKKTDNNNACMFGRKLRMLQVHSALLVKVAKAGKLFSIGRRMFCSSMHTMILMVIYGDV